MISDQIKVLRFASRGNQLMKNSCIKTCMLCRPQNRLHELLCEILNSLGFNTVYSVVSGASN